MRVVTPKKLKEFSLNNTQARIPLLNWYEIEKRRNGINLAMSNRILELLIMWEIIDMYLM
jgi:hypothetical protein